MQRMIVILCSLVYFISYLTRKNYAAIIVEFVDKTGISLPQASLALTGLAIFYGAGQLVSGYLGDRINPKYIIACGLFTTAAMNIALPFCKYVPLLVAVWCINGLAQAMMWPPIVKLLSSSLSDDEYKKSTVTVSNASQIGVILLYLLAPVCITYSSWKTVFYVSGSLAAVAAFGVIFLMPCIDMKPARAKNQNAKNKDTKKATAFPYLLFILIMLAIVLQGLMRDGVADWLPTYLESEFEISSEVAILLGVAPPVFAMACFTLVSWLSRKVFKNELFFAGLIFFTAFVASFLLAIFSSSSVVLSTVLSTLINGCMHGANLILVCLVPPFFKRNGNISLVSGLLNSCTYAGSALSGFGFALMATLFGWRGTIIGWAIICAVAAGICFAVVKSWQRHKNLEN